MGKWLILLLMILMSMPSRGAEIELGYSPITLHTFSRSQHFANKIDSRGALMYNPVFFARYNSFNLMVGIDSIGDEIGGIFWTPRLSENFDWVLGVYSNDKKIWDEGDWNSLALDVGLRYRIIPIGGVKYHKKINENLNFNIIITPFVINPSISFEF